MEWKKIDILLFKILGPIYSVDVLPFFFFFFLITYHIISIGDKLRVSNIFNFYNFKVIFNIFFFFFYKKICLVKSIIISNNKKK